MREFKIGDTVKVKTWDELFKQNVNEEINDDFTFVEEMEYLCGKIITITEDNFDGMYIAEIDKKGEEWTITPDMVTFLNDCVSDTPIRGFKEVKQSMKKHFDTVTLPTRGSKISAGYDFYLPTDITIKPNEKICVWSDVKAYMQEGEVLMVHVRSSIGIKKGLMLSNLTGVIDADYFENENNDGNIGIALYNYSNEVVELSKGERICQGVFMPFLVADNGNTDKERTGGIGSTNKEVI